MDLDSKMNIQRTQVMIVGEGGEIWSRCPSPPPQERHLASLGRGPSTPQQNSASDTSAAIKTSSLHSCYVVIGRYPRPLSRLSVAECDFLAIAASMTHAATE